MARRRLPLNEQTAAYIKWLLLNTNLYQDQIGALVDQNQGRVSEIKSGERFRDVKPLPYHGLT